MSKVSRNVTIKPTRPTRPGITFDLVGEDQLTGGGGVWDTLTRPRQRDALEWTGTTGLNYVLPLLIDGMEVRRGVDRVVEAECRRLLAWSANPTKQTGRPVVVKVTGPVMVPDTAAWVITALEWGTKVRNRDGHRVRQFVTVTLREYNTPVLLRSPVKRHKHRHGGSQDSP